MPAMTLLLLACASPRDGTAPGAPPDGAADSGASADTAADTAGDTGDDPPPVGGPCAAYAEAVAMGEVADPDLQELSGLAVSRLNPGVLWAHEDSGGEPVLYALATTGETLATLRLDGVENVDWEDLATAPCGDGWCLWVGDIGALASDRAEFAIHVVEEPLLDGTAEFVAAPDTRPFTYPGDPEDAEALAIAPSGEPVVITKRSDATAGVYVLGDGANVLEHLADVATGTVDEDLTARATAADIWPDPPRLLLRTYFHLYELDVTDLAAPGAPVELAYALEPQGEAIAWDPTDGGFWQVSEWDTPTLWYTGCAE